ncbi:FAD-dependent oxidoreductase [Nonomuraea ferruginea]
MNHVVVVGAGLSGVRSVEALRARGFGGRITLIGQERHRPYDRPPLSKSVLLGDADSSFVDSDLAALEVDFWPGVAAKALREGAVETTEGELGYDGLVIATGAEPILLPGDGPQHVLRTLDDSLELRARLVPGARVAVIGAGWIGAEVATAARRAGCAVTVVEAAPPRSRTPSGPSSAPAPSTGTRASTCAWTPWSPPSRKAAWRWSAAGSWTPTWW